MFKFIKQKLNNKRQEKAKKEYLKSIFEPRKEFLNNSRPLFLNEVSKKYGASFRQPIKINATNLVFRYAIGVVAMLLFIASGASVYANQTDVDSQSPLYPFKKLNENIQLTLAPKDKKTDLYEKFAERRVKEINSLVAKKSEKNSEEIKIRKEKLKEDFKNKINKIEEQNNYSGEKTIIVENNADSSEQEIEEVKNETMHLKLCNLDFINVENGDGELFWKKTEKLEKFKEKCDRVKKINSKQLEIDNNKNTNKEKNSSNEEEIKKVED
ncbi:hypothetical protein COV23_00015 [Candidatus Wolfebacteria bacterium CG10_big_fil_rev_8_21_14_0_10_31_9]|uniref:DUF5667 domain-containing protein n=1 Tax=Candidatus Wolfebacteria bacterium CG10_big_fil_rev_8_21_14_0_10_31_9 TaxID=1975070 RepID=A0A2H0RCX7_9BACT|nr:MAG: hypothetical protein COV23_00015 [Candidatus Wolfebacteria bacterium CG10_big_fil_rev_8_21_14_0_10_31_9]